MFLVMASSLYFSEGAKAVALLVCFYMPST